MSFDRPGLDTPKTVSDTEVNEALEHGGLDDDGQDFENVEHDEGERSPGPERDDVQRRPREQDVTEGESGQPVEPPA
jgi:hypothetical protein